MTTDLCAIATLASANENQPPSQDGQNLNHSPERIAAAGDQSAEIAATTLSSWSRSPFKRIFDCLGVVASLPLLIPVLLLVGAAVRLTSRGPVIFRQKRVGRGGRLFTIFKFRSLCDGPEGASGSRHFTAIGRRMRRWKLDELPQLLNVLLGDMSLVGPRPKMPEYEVESPPCRPGITGGATIVFAREDDLLGRVARLQAANCYRTVIMPAKQRLDTQYMARATFLSDVKLLVLTVLRRWDTDALQALFGAGVLTVLARPAGARFGASRGVAEPQGPALPRMARTASTEVITKL